MSTHLYFQIEVSSPRGWWHFARLRLSDDYLLFALLAGVRGDDVSLPVAERGVPKGLPPEWAEVSLSEDSLVVDDEAADLDLPDTCTRADAERWVSEGAAWFLEDESRVTHPDAFAHSWASAAELDKVRISYAKRSGRDIASIDAALALMATWEHAGSNSRCVFWFG